MPKADVATSVVELEKTSDPLVIHPHPIKVLKRRSGRQSQEGLSLLLDVDELFPTLKNESREHAAITRLLSSVQSKFLGLEEVWRKLYEALDDVHRDYQQMVIGLRLDPALLFSIYQRMLAIKEQWLSLRARALAPADDQEMTQESYDSLREEKESWIAIIYKIKKMLVTSH